MHTKRLLCRLLIGILLFAQLAIAAHACVQFSPTADHHSVMASASMQMSTVDSDPLMEMDCCDGMGQVQVVDDTNLCIAHCQFGQQSDQTHTPNVPATLLMVLYPLPLPAPAAESIRSAKAATSVLAAASPPHAILHCCFRV